MIPHSRRRPRALTFSRRISDLDRFGREVNKQIRVLNGLKPIDRAFVLSRVQILNYWTIRWRRGYWRVNVHLLERMMVFIAASLVNMKKRGFDESHQQRARHPDCAEGSQRPPAYATCSRPVKQKVRAVSRPCTMQSPYATSS